MILHELKDYYDRKAADPDSGIALEGFEFKELPFILVLDEEGNLVQVECTRQPIGKQLRAKPYLVPQAQKRTRGIKANLLWDNAEYLLGLTSEENEETKKKHEAFIEQIKNLDLGHEAGIEAILRFLSKDPVVKLMETEYAEEIKETNPFMSFRLVNDRELICQRSIIIDKIKNMDYASEKEGICLITGEKTFLARLQPAIKGVRGANSTGGNIVSFNLDAFDSYGKTQGANAPISETATFAYTTALNTLLGKDSKQKLQVGRDTTMVFWSARASTFENNFSSLFEEPTKDNKDIPDSLTEAVKSLYESMKVGAMPNTEAETKFFILGLSPNAARISIRFWQAGTVKEFSENIVQHFNDIAIEHASYEKDYLSLWRMLLSTAAQGKTDNIIPTIEGDWMRAILANTPYPDSLFQAVMRRIHADKEITHARAAIIKGYLNRKYRFKNKQEEITVSLDKSNQNVGYRLGRLFSLLERIQEDAHDRNINATIKDKYYSSASATPKSVFPILLRLKQHHLRKLSSANKGRAVNLEKILGEIADDISFFPTQLNLDEQGFFALGYYHQRQDFFKKAESTTTNEEENNGN